ncbi:MAG: hypothetical protein ABIP94_04340 [Planctomycetota bacterium]
MLLAACSSAPLDPDWQQRSAVVVELRGFDPPTQLPAGFDEPDAEGLIGIGDFVVFGLRLDRRGVKRDWFLHVAVEAIEVSPWTYRDGKPRHDVVVDCHVLDGASLDVGREQLRLRLEFLRRGLARACRGEGERIGQGFLSKGPDDWSERFRALVALNELLVVVRKSDALSGILWEVVDAPSLWSVLGNLGARVTQLYDFDNARPAAAVSLGPTMVPAWQLPVELRVNDAPALRSLVVVTDADSPWSLCAGVVAISAAHPTDPDVTFAMRLLAARRGRSL